MIAIDTSVAVKWFKPGERCESQALDLLSRFDGGEVEVAAAEILSLEVVRGLKNAQVRQPVLALTDERIGRASERLEGMFREGALLECPVAEVKALAKDLEIEISLYMADALHLATAIYLGATHFAVDDQHFLEPDVVKHAAGLGVEIVDLPRLIAALDSPPDPRSAPEP